MRNPHNEPLNGSSPSPAPAEAASSGKTPSPERKCVLTGEHDARGDLLRLAISPDGLVLPDPLARAPGRGAWLGVTRAELTTAMAKGKLKGALARAFRGATLTIPDDLPERIAQGLERVLLDRLGLELRAGKVLLGTERIAKAARNGKVVWLAHARDAAGDGADKLAQAWRVGLDEEGSGRKGVILPLDRLALSVALGRDNVVHLGVIDAGAAKRIAGPLARLNRYNGRFCGADDPPRPPGPGPLAVGDTATAAVTGD